MNTRTLIGALGGIGVVAGAAVALAPVVFPAPAVSVSTLTVRATDSAAVVIRYTKRCRTVLGTIVCPRDYDVRLMGQYNGGTTILARRARVALRDTVRFERPLCPDTLRVRGEVSAAGRAGADRSITGVSLWQPIRCSTMTPAEQRELAALNDSFPTVDRKVTMGDWAYKVPKAEREDMLTEMLRGARTAADSAGHRTSYAWADGSVDSMRVLVAGDTLTTFVGYKTAMCLLARNRYTGAVQVMGGKHADACEAARARYAAQRNG